MTYINFETNQITDETDSNGTLVDDLIAETLVILNKKGYQTLYSCAGHYDNGYHYFECDDLDAINKELLWEVVESKDDKYIVKTPILGVSIYIKFAELVVIPSYPDGFVYDPKHNAIYYELNIYDNQDQKIESELIEKEILEVNKILYDWAIDLS